jgi:hypothetical protein
MIGRENQAQFTGRYHFTLQKPEFKAGAEDHLEIIKVQSLSFLQGVFMDYKP